MPCIKRRQSTANVKRSRWKFPVSLKHQALESSTSESLRVGLKSFNLCFLNPSCPVSSSVSSELSVEKSITMDADAINVLLNELLTPTKLFSVDTGMRFPLLQNVPLPMPQPFLPQYQQGLLPKISFSAPKPFLAVGARRQRLHTDKTTIRTPSRLPIQALLRNVDINIPPSTPDHYETLGEQSVESTVLFRTLEDSTASTTAVRIKYTLSRPYHSLSLKHVMPWSDVDEAPGKKVHIQRA